MVYGAHFLFTSRSIARADHFYLFQNFLIILSFVFIIFLSFDDNRVKIFELKNI